MSSKSRNARESARKLPIAQWKLSKNSQKLPSNLNKLRILHKLWSLSNSSLNNQSNRLRNNNLNPNLNLNPNPNPRSQPCNNKKLNHLNQSKCKCQNNNLRQFLLPLLLEELLVLEEDATLAVRRVLLLLPPGGLPAKPGEEGLLVKLKLLKDKLNKL